MATITVKKTAGAIDSWFKKAAGSRGVRLKYGQKTFLLFDPKRISKSYAEKEYGFTPKELDGIVRKMNAQAEKDRKAGRSKKFNGNIDDLLGS